MVLAVWARVASIAVVIPLLCAFGGGSQDTNYIPDNPGQIDAGQAGVYNFNRSYRDTGGKTLRSDQSAASYSGCPVLITAGQSNDQGEAQTAYTPTNASNVHNFNPFDGALYAAADPMLGHSLFLPSPPAGYGYYGGRLADAIINSGPAKCIILVPLAIGGSAIGDWAPGGSLFPRLIGAVNRLNSRGFTKQYVLWGQGSKDANLGTPQLAYVGKGNALFGSLPLSVDKVFVAQQTWNGTTTNPPIIAAQTQPAPLGLINHLASPPIWQYVNDDALTGSVCGSGSQACRQADNLHYSDAGNATRAANAQIFLHASGTPF